MDAAIGKLIDKVGPAIKEGFNSLTKRVDNLISKSSGKIAEGLKKISERSRR